MPNYQPFLISEFKTGLYDYLKPWIRPQDAFEPLINANVYRGSFQKRHGSTIFGDQLADKSPVMGIMQYQNETTGLINLVAASEQYLYVYTAGIYPDSGTFAKVTAVQNSPFWSGNATGTLVIPTLWPNITPSSITITAYNAAGTVVATSTDDGATNLSVNGIIGAASTIVYATGIVTINFVGTTAGVTLKIACTVGTSPYFTGNITNFFNWCNWQPTSDLTSTSISYLYMTNGVDPVTLVNCDAVPYMTRPGFYIQAAGTSNISTALDVKTYNNRLLLLRPTSTVIATGISTLRNQDIAYSAEFNPTNFVADVAGNGGADSAATGDRIVSADFLRDNLLIAFSNSTWTYQVTGLTSPPFIFRKLNISKSCQCPYAGVAYDERITNLGNTGFVACDGVNVQRFDVPIIDYYETQIKQTYFNQDFSQRYDNLNQSWMFYPSIANLFLPNDDQAPGSDQALIYNFLENTWATYKNSFPMTCLGFFYIPVGSTWGTLNQAWEDTDEDWNSYGFQTSGRVLLGGDTSGNIYHLDNASAVQDGIKNVYAEVIATGTGVNNYAGVLSFPPILPGTFKPTDGTETFVDNKDGTLTGSAGGSGTIVYTTGAWTLLFHAVVPALTKITANYTRPGTSFNIEAKTTRWNPFMSLGQKTQFGYIDIFYSIASVDLNNIIEITLDFYVDNNNQPSASKILVLDGPSTSDYAWKRIYCNLSGEFIQIRFDPSEDSFFQILGFVLWARPAGRLTP